MPGIKKVLYPAGEQGNLDILASFELYRALLSFIAGGEESRSDEFVSQLLQDALDASGGETTNSQPSTARNRCRGTFKSVLPMVLLC